MSIVVPFNINETNWCAMFDKLNYTFKRLYQPMLDSTHFEIEASEYEKY